MWPSVLLPVVEPVAVPVPVPVVVPLVARNSVGSTVKACMTAWTSGSNVGHGKMGLGALSRCPWRAVTRVGTAKRNTRLDRGLGMEYWCGIRSDSDVSDVSQAAAVSGGTDSGTDTGTTVPVPV